MRIFRIIRKGDFMKKILIFFMTVTSLFLLSSCSSEQHDVYVTVYPLKFLTEELFELIIQ